MLAGKLRIITDSSASFESPHFVKDNKIKVVPLKIYIEGNTYLDGVDIDAETVFSYARTGAPPPRIEAPTTEDFEAIYKELNQTTDQIIVLVNSKKLTKTFDHAQTARASLLGRCDITVIDSMTTSLGLGFLVQSIAESAKQGVGLEEAVRIARGIVPRLYSVYYVDTLDYLHQSGLLGHTQAIIGKMLTIKPMLTIEGGQLIAMEKARNHSQAIDKMIEFASEFTQIEKLGILQNSTRPNDHTRMLQDRLALEFSRLNYPMMLYDPLLTALIGADGLGLAILESE